MTIYKLEVQKTTGSLIYASPVRPFGRTIGKQLRISTRNFPTDEEVEITKEMYEYLRKYSRIEIDGIKYREIDASSSFKDNTQIKTVAVTILDEEIEIEVKREDIIDLNKKINNHINELVEQIIENDKTDSKQAHELELLNNRSDLFIEESNEKNTSEDKIFTTVIILIGLTVLNILINFLISRS